MIDTKLERHQATSDLGVTSRTRIFALCDELDETRAKLDAKLAACAEIDTAQTAALDATREKLNDVKQAYAALDQNWCNIHNAMGDAVRRALGLPDATVPEIVAAIDSLRPHRSPTVSAIASADIAERAGGCPCDECVEAEVET